MANETRNVFISHIHEDDSKLGELKRLLSQSGIDAKDYSINSDKPNRAKSEDYIKNQILAPKIRQCSVLVVYISKDTKDSEYVNWEIEYADKLDKRIVGVWGNGEKGCDLPEALEEYRDALVGWHGSSIVDAILSDDHIQENPDGTPRPRRSILRHPC
ncbi:MAG TPA: TIR domain-containing protein [Mariprofundaceae bacterium]|nr:TIR domain-containing protein [Mariprofundaceae bacterium]